MWLRIIDDNVKDKGDKVIKKMGGIIIIKRNVNQKKTSQLSDDVNSTVRY